MTDLWQAGCPRCGTKPKVANARFCPRCGLERSTPMPPPPMQPAPPPVMPPQPFAPPPGYVMVPAQQVMSPRPAPPKKKSGSGCGCLIGLIILGAVIMAAIVLAFAPTFQGALTAAVGAISTQLQAQVNAAGS